ncbi:MAG: aspartate-semialdehyde dehydrogenase [Bacteroidales bacterium]|jgi:aspartate-semialdehyde dehydrogenase|nr:aspartate-semialdehyde dehydrogenase [Bacteroidales bacterium]NLO50374.1 aspartate-semialdehyde dehydrogenase [Bacteroidales bacterium]
MNIAVIGATGLVGQKMLEVLAEHNLAGETIIAAASSRSAGHTVSCDGRRITVLTIEQCLAERPDIALFSAGGDVSKAWAEKFAEAGTFVIDNSSAWRMHADVPLVVPEINAHTINPQTRIIANPNCSTIQLVMALAPLHSRYRIRRVVVSTYQSVTGSGIKGMQQLTDEEKGIDATGKAYPHPIHRNVLPHGGAFDETGYTTEEQKLVNETRKILQDDQMQITATVVRVPVMGGHSEAVNVEFFDDFDLAEVRRILELMPGVVVQDNPAAAVYPMPIRAEGKDEVFVGRIRRDLSQPNTLNMWVVSDNVRKGAATNTVQIAKWLIEQGLVKNV